MDCFQFIATKQPSISPARELPCPNSNFVCKVSLRKKKNNHRICRRIWCRAAVKYKGTYEREQTLSKLIEEKVTDAQQICKEDANSEECKVAWDEVEEVSQAKAHLRQRSVAHDPLEFFCKQNPDSDECRLIRKVTVSNRHKISENELGK